jgi:hypothetical protein
MYQFENLKMRKLINGYPFIKPLYQPFQITKSSNFQILK